MFIKFKIKLVYLGNQEL
jgi:hypothetical protein